MFFIMKINVLPDPMDIGLFGIGAVVPLPNDRSHLIKQLWLLGCGGLTPF